MSANFIGVLDLSINKKAGGNQEKEWEFSISLWSSVVSFLRKERLSDKDLVLVYSWENEGFVLGDIDEGESLMYWSNFRLNKDCSVGVGPLDVGLPKGILN